MSKYRLLHGPKLERKSWVYDDAAKKGEWVTVDVTEKAVELLFQDIDIAQDVTLADVFGLIADNETMLMVFRQDYAVELCSEVIKGAVLKDEPKPESIEYLELHQLWNMDSDTKECFGTGRFQLHGIGHLLEEDVAEDGYVMYHKGTRVNWGVSLTPVREMLHLPVRVNKEVRICEDNLDAKQYGRVIQTLNSARITLGTFIREVLWELSWHGTPDESAAVGDDLKEQVDELKAGTAETIPSEDVFESLGFTPQKVVNAHFFVNSDDFTSSELYHAVHALEDNALARDGLAKELEGKLMLREAHELFTGKQLRKAMREFRHGSDDTREAVKAVL